MRSIHSTLRNVFRWSSARAACARASIASTIACALICLVASCSHPVREPTLISELPVEALAPMDAYRIAPGDELEISFFHTPELNAVVIVRPDGKIGLPLAQGVQAAGASPEELAQTLRALYARELREPEVAVNVRTFSDQLVHVGGEVGAPGVVPLVGRLTVLDAVLQAGGTLPRAKRDEILLLRRKSDGGHFVIPIDLAAVIDGRRPEDNLALRAFDAVIVPPSGVANVNTFVDLYIRQNLPIDFGVGLRPDGL